MSFAARLLTALGFLVALTSGGDAFADARTAAARRQAETETRQWLDLVYAEDCPTFGSGPNIRGLDSPEAVLNVINQEWNYASRTLSGLPNFLSQTQLNPAFRGRDAEVRDMVETQKAYAIGSLARWTLATWAYMARQSSDFPPWATGGGPVAPFRRAPEDLRRLAATAQTANVEVGALQTLAAKMAQCNQAIEQTLITTNAASIRQGIQEAQTTGELDAIGQRYDFTVGGDAQIASLGALLGQRRSTVAQAEASARNAQLSAQRAAYERTMRQNLGAARSFVLAMRGGNVSQAASFLAENVTLETPFDRGYGKERVTEMMREGLSRGTGSIGDPRVDGAHILAPAETSQGAANLFFDFDASGKISLLRGRPR